MLSCKYRIDVRVGMIFNERSSSKYRQKYRINNRTQKYDYCGKLKLVRPQMKAHVCYDRQSRHIEQVIVYNNGH